MKAKAIFDQILKCESAKLNAMLSCIGVCESKRRGERILSKAKIARKILVVWDRTSCSGVLSIISNSNRQL